MGEQSTKHISPFSFIAENEWPHKPEQRPTTAPSSAKRDASISDTTAEAVIAAGKRRRNETAEALPIDPIARAIIMAGRKARNEI